MEKDLIYLRIDKKTKDAIEALKAVTGQDSNQVFYTILKQNGIELNQQKIDNMFANVNTTKLKTEIAQARLKQLQEELMEKLNLSKDDISKIMQ
jgi:isopropylmalate/homocitrate/citramalate synthase